MTTYLLMEPGNVSDWLEHDSKEILERGFAMYLRDDEQKEKIDMRFMAKRNVIRHLIWNNPEAVEYCISFVKNGFEEWCEKCRNSGRPKSQKRVKNEYVIIALHKWAIINGEAKIDYFIKNLKAKFGNF